MAIFENLMKKWGGVQAKIILFVIYVFWAGVGRFISRSKHTPDKWQETFGETNLKDQH